MAAPALPGREILTSGDEPMRVVLGGESDVSVSSFEFMETTGRPDHDVSGHMSVAWASVRFVLIPAAREGQKRRGMDM